MKDAAQIRQGVFPEGKEGLNVPLRLGVVIGRKYLCPDILREEDMSIPFETAACESGRIHGSTMLPVHFFRGSKAAHMFGGAKLNLCQQGV